MSALSVVEHLKSLAADPQNRATIVKDQGCLAGLVLFLDNKDPQVISTALEALNFLADYSPNRPCMKEEMGLLLSLKTIMNGTDTELQSLAKEVHDKVMLPKKRKAPSRMGNNSNNKSFFLGTSNKKAKLIVLQIKGLTNLVARKLCEEQMLKTRGVISFTFDMNKSRMMVRCRHDCLPKDLVRKINDTKILHANQVVKNECGEETMLSFGLGTSTSCKVPATLPDYLPEDDEVEIADNAVAKVGGDKENGGGWFGSVSNFISKSLYW
ncbi:armadillo repeat-containing protein 1 [Nematostella vectensis]|uniref:armadillo repeat-containing protein 1 n=1 Tax=Nematostella vectensis TaxID=45351 RepID=UPI002076E605|nr:armadillo repeat-containing protein 1 [Nematostella vectensis]